MDSFWKQPAQQTVCETWFQSTVLSAFIVSFACTLYWVKLTVRSQLEHGDENPQSPSKSPLDISQQLHWGSPSRSANPSGTLYSLAISIISLLQGMSDTVHLAAKDGNNQASLSEIEDQTARFIIWGKNLGAFHEADQHVSLDFRLRNSSRLRQSLFRVLQHLEESLQKSKFPQHVAVPMRVVHVLEAIADSEN